MKIFKQYTDTLKKMSTQVKGQLIIEFFDTIFSGMGMQGNMNMQGGMGMQSGMAMQQGTMGIQNRGMMGMQQGNMGMQQGMMGNNSFQGAGF